MDGLSECPDPAPARPTASTMPLSETSFPAPLRRRTLRPASACTLLWLCAMAEAQPVEPRPEAPAAAASAPRPAAARRGGPTPPANQPADLQRVQITGSTAADPDTLQRQQSTAAKIIVGREEIDRFGDSNIGDVLKRLPGVTTGGAPGRRGGPRMRGLGGGYTQLLIDGEPIPAGFSLESLTPEQVERIEMLRAPTAEFGARAIAGTINIVLREALQKRLNDLRLGATVEKGHASPGVSWTRNDRLGERPGSAYNLSVSAFDRTRTSDIDNRTTVRGLDGVPIEQQVETGEERDHRRGLNISARLQWQLGEGENLTVQPVLFVSRGDSTGTRRLDQPVGEDPSLYARATTHSDSRFAVARTNLQWRKRLGSDTRVELRGSAGGFDSHSADLRQESDAAGLPKRTLDDRSDIRERSWTSVGKLSHDLGSNHALVTGWDLEGIRREEARTSLQDGRSLLPDDGKELQAASRRVALYVQDEWNPSPQWSAYAGLRWERIDTRSEGSASAVSNRSAVWTPLFQAVWKPHEKSRDQVRVALTRSYKAPTLRSLIARPSISTRYPTDRTNAVTSPDSIGNPDLRPELATGLDLAYEHYLTAGGLVSVNLFHRRIRDLIRNVVDPVARDVTWANAPRFVSQPRNIGNAVTQGIELEAKGRLSEFVTDAPPVQLRSNLSLFRSRVSGLAGPDNRLEEQPAMTANLGADYRFRSLPLTLGGNLNWTPSYEVQVTTTQRRSFSTKRSLEAFGVWTFSPAMQLRVGANDIAPLDYTTATVFDLGATRHLTESRSHTRMQWSVRLELKL